MTKFALILPDGAADEPVPALGNRTPLEAALTPNMDWIAAHGRQGLIRTVPAGFIPGSDIATLSVMGFDPARYYSGRAPLEAAARGIHGGPDDLIFRCNLVTILDGRMADFTAGHIAQTEAERLIAELGPLGSRLGVAFHPGVSYRNLMVMRDAKGVDCTTTGPHDIPDAPVAAHRPRGDGAARVIEIMDAARALLAGHEVNRERHQRGEHPVTDIWLWGQGRLKPLDSLESRFGVRGACIAAVDLIRGIAACAGLAIIPVAGATGYLDTDYEAKGAAARAALDEYDLIVVHIEAPDEAGHLGDAAEKVKAIERVDSAIVGPLLDELKRYPGWRIAVVPDHPTPVGTRKHSAAPPPFCDAGTGVSAGGSRGFGETEAAETGLLIDPGHGFMERFLH